MDGQWKLFQVFEKERVDLPHRNAGSVHAPDSEIALENARDVFVRRPPCLSLWVVPQEAIFAKTAQELAEGGFQTDPVAGGEGETYLVFQKHGQTARETYVAHVGEVQASSAEAALERALESFDHNNVFVWWVVPERAVKKSNPDDVVSMFDPARAKTYRNHLSYPVEPIMRELKSAEGMEE